MTDREAMKLALEVLERCPALYRAPEAATALRDRLAQPKQEPVAWSVPGFGFLFPDEYSAQRYLNNVESAAKPTPLYTAPRQALDHVPDTTKMIEPDMGIDRGAWDGVPDATKWVDELRGGDETEQEPVAWMYVNRDGECEQIEFGTAFGDPSVTLLYTAPPKQSEQTVSLEEYKRLQRLVTSQGIRLMEYESEQEPVACIVGMKGSAYDSPETKRAYTYEHQPHNGVAWKLGEACSNASRAQAGDYIDRCLVLLKELQAAGYGVFDLGAEYTAPPKREWVGLTDNEFTAIARKYSLPTRVGLEYFKDELEAKLKEKNNV